MPQLRFALRQEGVLPAVLLELARQVDLPPVFLAELEACVCQAYGLGHTSAEAEEDRSTGSN